MIRFLVMHIKLGKITLEDVPAKYRAAVEAALTGGSE